MQTALCLCFDVLLESCSGRFCVGRGCVSRSQRHHAGGIESTEEHSCWTPFRPEQDDKECFVFVIAFFDLYYFCFLLCFLKLFIFYLSCLISFLPYLCSSQFSGHKVLDIKFSFMETPLYTALPVVTHVYSVFTVFCPFCLQIISNLNLLNNCY